MSSATTPRTCTPSSASSCGPASRPDAFTNARALPSYIRHVSARAFVIRVACSLCQTYDEPEWARSGALVRRHERERSDRTCRLAPNELVDAEEVDDEDQRLAALDHATGALLAVAQVGRDRE